MTEEELQQLESKVAELKAWKAFKTSQQLSNPLDVISRKIIKGFSIVPTNNFYTIVTGTSLNDLVTLGIEFTINGKKRACLATLVLHECSAAASDIITNVSGSHNLKNGDGVAFTTSDTLPAGLSDIDFYYVINSSNTTFKVSLTLNGSAVDITDSGSGTQYWAKL